RHRSQGRRLSAAAPLRRAVAAAPAGRTAEGRADPAGRRPCPGLGPRRQGQGQYDRDRPRLARLCARDPAPAASVLAQHGLAQEEPLVRGGGSALPSRADSGDFGVMQTCLALLPLWEKVARGARRMRGRLASHSFFKVLRAERPPSSERLRRPPSPTRGEGKVVRGVLLTCSLLLLAACATPHLQPPLTPPAGFNGARIEEGTLGRGAFVVQDGARLPYLRWSPEGRTPWAVIIALH